jgi:hypothetical protein
MILKPVALFTIAMLLGEGGALAESCKVQSSSPPGQWKFVRAYDPDTGAVVLRQAINGGDSKSVTVSGRHVRVESKLPGHTHYQPAVVASCKGGNTVRT